MTRLRWILSLFLAMIPIAIAISHLSASSITIPSQPQLATNTVTLVGTATGVTVFTATSGAVQLITCTPYLKAAAAGLTSTSVQTDDGTVTVILASTILASLGVSGTPLTAYQTPIQLASGKHVTYTIVGTGTGSGSLQISCTWRPIDAGATLQ